MTRRGDYSVELIDATTSQPFKQHPGKNGIDGYYEVEPGLEYLIRAKNNGNNKVITVTFAVDGQDLGYNSMISPGQSVDKGLWAYDQITATSGHKALQFHKSFNQSSRSVDDNDKANNYANNIGIVRATFYEYIKLDGYFSMSSITSKFNDDNQVHVGNNEDSKKFLKSSAGKKQILRHDSGRRDNWKLGCKLGTIKVKYCSVVGLIADGVLPKPPMWEWYKLIKPSAIAKASASTTPKVDPVVLKHDLHDNNGNVLETKEYELFDMTALEDSDSEAD